MISRDVKIHEDGVPELESENAGNVQSNPKPANLVFFDFPQPPQHVERNSKLVGSIGMDLQSGDESASSSSEVREGLSLDSDSGNASLGVGDNTSDTPADSTLRRSTRVCRPPGPYQATTNLQLCSINGSHLWAV